MYLSLQKGDSAVIKATVRHGSGALQVLVTAGADLNLKNQVRYIVTMDTALQSGLLILGGSNSSDDLSKKWWGRSCRYSPNWRKY